MHSILVHQLNCQQLQELLRVIVREELSSFKINNKPISNAEEIKFLSKKEAALFLKISLPTLTKLIKSGDVKALRLGKSRYRFRKTDLENSLIKKKYKDVL